MSDAGHPRYMAFPLSGKVQMCLDCGAIVGLDACHDQWHAQLEDVEADLGRALLPGVRDGAALARAWVGDGVTAGLSGTEKPRPT
jgi:hypothetical protein